MPAALSHHGTQHEREREQPADQRADQSNGGDGIAGAGQQGLNTELATPNPKRRSEATRIARHVGEKLSITSTKPMATALPGKALSLRLPWSFSVPPLCLCEKVHLLLAAKDSSYSVKDVTPGVGQIGAVPAHRPAPGAGAARDGEQLIADSSAIAMHLESSTPDPALLPSAAERAGVVAGGLGRTRPWPPRRGWYISGCGGRSRAARHCCPMPIAVAQFDQGCPGRSARCGPLLPCRWSAIR